MLRHYVIGDVHGHYETLVALLSKLPKDSVPIFVGDLIDRGPKSAEVVRLIREKGYPCVMGNHEELMFTYGYAFAQNYRAGTPMVTHNPWFANGGIQTLQSYGLVRLESGRPERIDGNEAALERFESDMGWMQTLPDYYDAGLASADGKAVIVSHAPLATVWALRNIDSMYATFHRLATTNRREPDPDAPVFNIFGHTPIPAVPEVRLHYVNVDTGCYKREESFGYLSAYCIETGEVFSQRRAEAV